MLDRRVNNTPSALGFGNKQVKSDGRHRIAELIHVVPDLFQQGADFSWAGKLAESRQLP